MTKDGRDLLSVLEKELEYLEGGGYRKSPRVIWRPQFVFEDSPTCLNSDLTKPRKPCSECVMAELVPESKASKKFPCRYIPLNEDGETVDSYYRSGTREDLEKTLSAWLRQQIQKLETRDSGDPAAGATEIHIKAKCAE